MHTKRTQHKLRTPAMGGTRAIVLGLLVLASTPITAPRALAQTPDNWDTFIWPLCGRLGEDPGGWVDGNDCPTANDPYQAMHTDVPIHHGYGFRNFTNTSRPIDFHRGMDFRTFQTTLDNGFVGNPVFSTTEGWVHKVTGSGVDRTIEMKVPREAGTAHLKTCSSDNPCLRVRYQHVQGVKVSSGDVLAKGEHIAYTGASSSGFKHLHFEIRQPQQRYFQSTNGDWYSGNSAYYKDAVNAMRFLPNWPNTVDIDVEFEDPLNNVFSGFTGEPPTAVVTMNAAHGSFHLDFERLELKVYEYDSAQDLWVLVEKDENALLQETGALALIEAEPSHMQVSGYSVASGATGFAEYNPELLNRMYTPYPASSSKWTVEKTKTYYREMFGQSHPGSDGIVELNANGSMPTDGHRIHAFDYLLVTAAPNTESSDQSSWSVTVGFQGYDIDLNDDLCFAAKAYLVPTVNPIDPNGAPFGGTAAKAWYETNPARSCFSAPFEDA